MKKIKLNSKIKFGENVSFIRRIYISSSIIALILMVVGLVAEPEEYVFFITLGLAGAITLYTFAELFDRLDKIVKNLEEINTKNK